MKVQSKFFQIETRQELEPLAPDHDNTGTYRTMINFTFAPGKGGLFLTRSKMPDKGKKGFLSKVEKETMNKFILDLREDFEFLIKHIKDKK